MPTSDLPTAQNFLLHPDHSEARAEAEKLFDRVQAELEVLLPDSADIRHIGATAVPGCLTKGDLDIVVRVPETDFAGADQALACRFQRNLGSTRTATFAAFEDGATTPHLGVQLTTVGGDDDHFHLFTDALKCDADIVARYNALKMEFHGQPMDAYRSAKDVFVTRVLAAAQTSALLSRRLR